MAILVQSNKKPSVTFPSQTGSIVTFNSQYAGLPLKSCNVNIPVTQEGTGDPSPDNVRNFVGISSLDFTANSVVKTFQFGQTIYAGELDVLTGIFTATHKMVDLGTLDWFNQGSYFYQISNLGVKSSTTNWLSNCIKQRPSTTSWINMLPWEGGFGGTQFRVKDDGTSQTSVDFKTRVQGFMLFYELETPEVINLGGMEIATLQGENNLFASVGTTTASFIKIGG